MTVDIDEMSYTYLIQLLNEKFYSTTKISELQQINKLYKILKFESETWLHKNQLNSTAFQPIFHKKGIKTYEQNIQFV